MNTEKSINTEIKPSDIIFTLSDSGNAERFSAHYGDWCRYVPDLNIWRVYNGQYWADDENLVMMKFLGLQTVRTIYGEIEEYDDANDRRDMANHALKSEAAERIKAMITMLPTQHDINLSVSDWDTSKYLLNVNNGTINLLSGELQTHNKYDYITAIIPIDYQPDAECPLWHQFLDRATDNNEELKTYLQRAAGYCLTGDTRKQIFFFLYGLGNNGKSVFTSTLRKLLGVYAARVSTELFMLKDKGSGNGHKEGLANLYGKRLVIASELEDGKHLSVSLVKDLTGGETIRADRKYQHEIEFMPECKLWLVGNHKPVIKDTTLSIWRRVKLVPFTNTIPPEDIDEALVQKLQLEYPGILAWCVQGCLEWQKNGLNEPEMVSIATNDYREDQDILHDFLNERCFFQPSASITVKELYQEYKQWADDNDLHPLGKKWFGERLVEKGIRKAPGNEHQTTWYGIRLSTNEEKVDSGNYGKNGNELPKTFLREESLEKKSGKCLPKLPILPKPEKICHICGSTNWWLRGNDWICGRCHPRPEGSK